MKPWISVVVPSYNQAQFVEQTLQSLLEQSSPGLEIIVVDGGSTDGSVDIIRRYESRLAYWVSEKDRGQSHALNKGFAKASGVWLGWLNSDDLLLPGALAALHAGILAEPNREWWIGGGYFIDEHGQKLSDYNPPHGLVKAADLSDWRKFWFAQPGTFFSRDLFERAGAQVNETLHYAMDLELWLRLLRLAAPGMLKGQISGYRLHSEAKTSVLTADGEVEIMRVLVDALGIEAALARVRSSAQDREDFQRKLQRLESVIGPALAIYSPLKKLFRR